MSEKFYLLQVQLLSFNVHFLFTVKMVRIEIKYFFFHFLKKFWKMHMTFCPDNDDITKSLKRDNVYKLCLWFLEEHNYLPCINTLACSRATYRACA